MLRVPSTLALYRLTEMDCFYKKSLFIFHRRKQVHIHVRWHEGEEMMRVFIFVWNITLILQIHTLGSQKVANEKVSSCFSPIQKFI